jgi:benzoyl-CoA reductase subunit C
MAETKELIAKFTEVYDNRHLLAKQWRNEGRFKKVIGYTYAFMPEELIYAAGALPVQLTETEERSAHSTGSIYIPEFFCDYCQSVTGQALDGMYSYLDGVIFSNACVPLKVAADVWDLEVNTPYFRMLTCPCVANEQARAYTRTQFQRLKKDMEQLCKTEVTDEALRRAIRIYNENRALIHELYELRKRDGSLITGRDAFEVVKASLVMPGDMHNELLKELLTHLKAKQPGVSKGVRVMVSAFIFEEAAIARPNFVAMIENAGGNVVLDDLARGPRYWWGDSKPEELEPKGDPLDALVDHYLGKIPLAFKVSEQYRAKLYVDAAVAAGVKGVIFFIPMYCESVLFQQPYIEKQLRDRSIATLALETVSSMEEGTLATRIGAFIETLGAA